MYDALCDAHVMAYWDWPGAQSLEDAEAFVGAHCDEVARGSAHFRSICRDGAVIGTCDLREVDDHRKRAEVGFMLIRGIGARATRARRWARLSPMRSRCWDSRGCRRASTPGTPARRACSWASASGAKDGLAASSCATASGAIARCTGWCERK